MSVEPVRCNVCGSSFVSGGRLVRDWVWALVLVGATAVAAGIVAVVVAVGAAVAGEL